MIGVVVYKPSLLNETVLFCLFSPIFALAHLISLRAFVI